MNQSPVWSTWTAQQIGGPVVKSNFEKYFQLHIYSFYFQLLLSDFPEILGKLINNQNNEAAILTKKEKFPQELVIIVQRCRSHLRIKMETGDSSQPEIIIGSSRSQQQNATEKSALVPPRHSYFFYKLKRKRTEDAVDICEIEKNGQIIAVSAVKSSSVFRSPFRCHDDHKAAIHFQCKLVEPFGEEILTMSGYQNFICCGSRVFAKFRKAGQLLGSVELNGNNAYCVKGREGEVVCNVVGPSRCDLVFLPCVLSPMEFRILLPDNNLEVGKIGNKWEEDVPYKAGRDQYGACLPGDLDEERQWLVLGASLLLRWQFWRPLNNGLWCLGFTALIVLVLAAAVVATVWFVSFDQHVS